MSRVPLTYVVCRQTTIFTRSRRRNSLDFPVKPSVREHIDDGWSKRADVLRDVSNTRSYCDRVPGKTMYVFVRVKVYKRINNAIRLIRRKIRSNPRLVNFPSLLLFFTLSPRRANAIFPVCTKSIEHWKQKQKPYRKVDRSRQRERNRFITTRTFFITRFL